MSVPVAVKTLRAFTDEMYGVRDNAEAVRHLAGEFRKESTLLTTLRHPNVLESHGVTYTGEVMFGERIPHSIVTELADCNLQSLIHDNGGRELGDIQKILKLAIGILRGLMYLHSQTPPVLHRFVLKQLSAFHQIFKWFSFLYEPSNE